MKRILFCLLPLALCVLLAGCVTGKGWQGLVPGKDVHIDRLTDELSTPWGSRKFVAEGVDSKVNPEGDRKSAK